METKLVEEIKSLNNKLTATEKTMLNMITQVCTTSYFVFIDHIVTVTARPHQMISQL